MAELNHYAGSGTPPFTSQVRYRKGAKSETLTEAATLTKRTANLLRLDPGGASRDVTLPAVGESEGLWFEILNAADAAEDLVIKDAAGATVLTISQNEKAKVACDGAAWFHLGIESIALS